MVASILPTYTPSTPVVGSKVNIFFLKVVMLHIKLKGMERREPCKQMFIITLPSTPGVGGVKGFKLFFSESGHVAYQNEGKEV